MSMKSWNIGIKHMADIFGVHTSAKVLCRVNQETSLVLFPNSITVS